MGILPQEDKVGMMENEILKDCKQFAERHRGKNKTSGPHWSTIIRFTPLFDEAVRLQEEVNQLRNEVHEAWQQGHKAGIERR